MRHKRKKMKMSTNLINWDYYQNTFPIDQKMYMNISQIS